ncbi:histidine phosphatase family protein [Rhodomicrobium sp. Az07]|uniref:SixA phosphatase family protein n=1 Tax=Rhodomicrobium sp. Az07 TaxID=2839034 RepID=UPI001BE65E49|nr:histidine phosphatase family protein [Rhodomicrobium sp. Az07]MBT3070096.1 histidine phosphatase family protein [Rhodomicrobium sp. Az07]
MKTVTLFRHAKSGDKDNPNIDDFDRPLSDRGLKAAPKMGAALRDRGVRPDLVLCSPSVRTSQTLTLASAAAWDDPPKIDFDKKIYEASERTLLKLLRECPEDAGHIMLVGHNPGLQDLAVSLAQPGSDERHALKEKLPTAAIVSFEFDADAWNDLEPGTGRVRLFLTPNTLPHGQGQE